MSGTVIVRLSKEPDGWLRATAEAKGVFGRFLIREQFEQAKTKAPLKSFPSYS